MENELVAKFFQGVDDNVSLQLFIKTSVAIEGNLYTYFCFSLFWGMYIHEFT